MKHSLPHHRHARGGYVFLVTVLMVGVIATATAVSLMLLSWAAEQNGYLVQRSTQAYEYANTCAERALRKLRIDPSYAGEETFSFATGSCSILSIGGSGNEHRTLCTSGVVDNISRRLQIDIDRLYPSVRVSSWVEVLSSFECQ